MTPTSLRFEAWILGFLSDRAIRASTVTDVTGFSSRFILNQLHVRGMPEGVIDSKLLEGVRYWEAGPRFEEAMAWALKAGWDEWPEAMELADGRAAWMREGAARF